MKSMYQFICFIEKQFAEKTAFQYWDEDLRGINAVTFREYVRDIRNYATRLSQQFSNVKGKHIGLLATNSYEYVVALMGIILAQGVAVPLNFNERLSVLKNEIELAELSLLLVDGNYQQVELLFDTGINIPTENLASALEFCDQSGTIEDAPEMLDEMAVLLFTSGTTGQNKGVMLSLRNIFAMARYNKRVYDRALEYLGVDSLSVLALMPFYHVAGLNIPFAFNYFGTACCICSGIKNLYRDLQESYATYIAVPPIVLEDFKENLLRGTREKLANLKVIITGGATFDHEILEIFSQAGILVLDAYGMTETCGIAAASVIGETNEFKRLHSVGTLEEECRALIRDGEVCFQGDVVTKGYYRDPVATEEAFDGDGWFHSGDMGYLDEEGYLFLTGRKKNLIILSSGENVSPEELETLLSRNPDIQECLVKEKEQRICAEIYCDLKKQNEIRTWILQMNKEVALYKRITVIEFRDQPFEKISLGKIKRNV